MKNLTLTVLVALALTACESQKIKSDATEARIEPGPARAAGGPIKPAQPEAVSQALLPPLTVEMPKAAAKPLEPRFDLVVNSAPDNQVFMALVSGTRYSMLVHPDIKETLSVN